MKITLQVGVAGILISVVIWQLGRVKKAGSIITGSDPLFLMLLILGVYTADPVQLVFGCFGAGCCSFD